MAKAKFKPGSKVISVFYTTHKDKVGGGDLYAQQLAKAFDEVTNMRYLGPSPHREMRKNHSFDHRFKHTNLQSASDVFIACSHFQVPSNELGTMAPRVRFERTRAMPTSLADWLHTMLGDLG